MKAARRRVIRVLFNLIASLCALVVLQIQETEFGIHRNSLSESIINNSLLVHNKAIEKKEPEKNLLTPEF